VIRSFRDKTTEAVFNGECPKGFPADLVKVARRKLRYLNAAADLGDLGNIRSGSTISSGCVLFGRRMARRRSRSWTTIKRGPAMAKRLKPMHPGEVLREEFLLPLKLSAGALAKVCGLPRTRIERIVSEQTGISADTALRLAKALGTTAQLWLNLQNDYDVEIAKRDLGKTLDHIEIVNKPRAA
jgi:addiction module HigA family antidote